jgi:hypothetical protein
MVPVAFVFRPDIDKLLTTLVDCRDFLVLKSESDSDEEFVASSIEVLSDHVDVGLFSTDVVFTPIRSRYWQMSLAQARNDRISVVDELRVVVRRSYRISRR